MENCDMLQTMIIYSKCRFIYRSRFLYYLYISLYAFDSSDGGVDNLWDEI